MVASLIYAALRFVLDQLVVQRRTEAELQAEVLALRHQLNVFGTAGRENLAGGRATG